MSYHELGNTSSQCSKKWSDREIWQRKRKEDGEEGRKAGIPSSGERGERLTAATNLRRMPELGRVGPFLHREERDERGVRERAVSKS